MLSVPSTTDGIDALLDALSELLVRLEAAERQPPTHPQPTHSERRAELQYTPLLTPESASLALHHLQQAEELFRQVGDHRGMAIAAAQSGAVYAALGSCPEALLCYAKGLALFVRAGHLDPARQCTDNITMIQGYLAEQQQALARLTWSLIEIGH